MIKHIATIALLAALIGMTGCGTMRDWRSTLDERLPVYGHRNWIVVADSAYPSQSAPGIETIHTGQGQIEVLKKVLEAVEEAPHVQAKVMVDRELEHVAEADAPGIEAYRQQLKAVLAGKQVIVKPHEDIIRKLDEGSRLFNVLLLKTDMTLPYTSVFLELDCGYWNAGKEQRLRQSIAAKGKQ